MKKTTSDCSGSNSTQSSSWLAASQHKSATRAVLPIESGTADEPGRFALL